MGPLRNLMNAREETHEEGGVFPSPLVLYWDASGGGLGFLILPLMNRQETCVLSGRLAELLSE